MPKSSALSLIDSFTTHWFWEYIPKQRISKGEVVGLGIFSQFMTRGNECLGGETKGRLGGLGLTGVPADLAEGGLRSGRGRAEGNRPGRTHKHSQEEGCGNLSSAETGSPARLSSASGGI